MSFFRILIVLLLSCHLLAVENGFCAQVPDFHGYINDYAGMISPETERRLSEALRDLDQSDSTQVAVLTIDTLGGDALEDFSIRTVDAWKIGQKGKDNGILLLVVKKDRKSRIEVGRGLEGVLTDLQAGRVIDNIITPLFREGRFDEGFEAGISAVISIVRGEFTGLPTAGRPAERRGAPLPSYFLPMALLLVFLGKISRAAGMIAGAVLSPLLAFLGFSLPFGLPALLISILLGGLAGLVIPLFFSSFFRGGGHWHSGGGFRSGGFGGGGFGGGGFGGFGGGGFGGGGASGRW